MLNDIINGCLSQSAFINMSKIAFIKRIILIN